MKRDAAMEELIERVEKATGPDRRIDAAIAAAIGDLDEFDPHGFVVPVRYRVSDDELRVEAWTGEGKDAWRQASRLPRNYTGSIDTASTLREPGWEYTISTLYGIAHVELPLNDTRISPIHVRREDGNVPAAICEAALKARAALASSAGGGK